MKGRTYQVLAVVICVGITLTACTGEKERPTPAIPSDNVSATLPISLPHSGAPKVSNPLPASVLSGNPCTDALTPTQIEVIFGKKVSGEPENFETGPKCSWSNLNTGAVLSIFYKTVSKQGLSALYQNTQPQSEIWKVLPHIQEFPAVAYRGKGNIPNLCTVSVGLADDMAVDTATVLGDTVKDTADPCDVAAEIANDVVTTLRGKAGS